MNKLILIGNGFDLAHGLKTSYGDFVVHYLNSIIDWNSRDGVFEDRFLRIEYCPLEIGEATIHKQNRDAISWLNTTKSKVTQKSLFFSRIYSQLQSNWVDIENEFFNLIVEHSESIDDITVLNDDFEFLRIKLIEYLALIESETQFEKIIAYLDLFKSKVNSSTDKICILNFNYTNLCSKYFGSRNNPNSRYKIINIHGSLDGSSGLPIFGIGDEHHKKYDDFKDHPHLSTILKYSKSFQYQRNNNHKKLEYFLTTRPLQPKRNFIIEIYGHSCGLSDRTLLKYLFQHPLCQEITVFHYKNEDNYIERSYDIWRHFDDSQTYRERLMPFAPENIMPQKISD